MTEAMTERATPLSGSGVVRSIWRLAGARRRPYLAGLLLQAIAGGLKAVPAGILILVMDALARDALDQDQVWFWVAALAASLLAQWLVNFFALRQLWVTSYEMAGDLRMRVLDHLRRLPLGYHTGRQTGDTVSALTQDLKMVEMVPAQGLPALVNAITVPIVVGIFALTVDWRMTLATFVSIPVALPLFIWSQRRLQAIAHRRQDALAEASARMLEFVQGIAVIKAFNQTGDRLVRFRAAVGALRDLSLAMVPQLAVPLTAFAAVLEFGFTLVLLAGGFLLFGGAISVTTFVIFAVIALRVYAPLQELSTYAELMRIGEAALARLVRILATQPLPEPATPRAPYDAGIAFDNVSFAYRDEQGGATPVLRDVSFAIPPRSLTALVGPSGSGKTTVTNLIARFWDVDAGRVLIGGVDVREIGSERLLEMISIVFQDVYLFNDTVLENIRFGRPTATLAEVTAAAWAAQCHDFIERLPNGYDTILGEGGNTLSGGEKQRISIARAILKDAPIILLDEATAAIDPSNERVIQAALTALIAEKTLVVIAHRLATIRDADQILVLSEGRVVERGVHADLLAENGLYARFWRERMQARGWRLAAAAPSSSAGASHHVVR